MENPVTSLLRDSHQPPPIGIWPPALGWWLIMLMLLVGGWLCYQFVWPRVLHARKRRRWLSVLARLRAQAQEPAAAHHALMQTSELLRKCAAKRFASRHAGTLPGQAWLDFLNETSETPVFTGAMGRALLIGPYCPRMQLTEDELQQLFDAIGQWIIKHV